MKPNLREACCHGSDWIGDELDEPFATRNSGHRVFPSSVQSLIDESDTSSHTLGQLRPGCSAGKGQFRLRHGRLLLASHQRDELVKLLRNCAFAATIG